MMLCITRKWNQSVIRLAQVFSRTISQTIRRGNTMIISLIAVCVILTSMLATCQEEEKDEYGDYRRDGEYRLVSKPNAPDYVAYLNASGVPEAKMKIMTSPEAKVTMTIKNLKPGEQGNGWGRMYNLRIVSKTAGDAGDAGEVTFEINFDIWAKEFRDIEQTWMNDQKFKIFSSNPLTNLIHFRLFFPKHDEWMMIDYKNSTTTHVRLEWVKTRATLTFERVTA